MMDLFAATQHFEPIRIEDADIRLLRGLSTAQSYDRLLKSLIEEINWRQESIRIYGKVMAQPRLVAWYGDAGKTYSYSGIALKPAPWNSLLQDLRRRVEDATEKRFNSVFLNLYRDHKDSMGFHSDDEPELGPRPVIASLTFGATRVFTLKHKSRPDQPSIKLALEAGSVLLMQGDTQRFWKHGIMKQTHSCGPRVNLTFRTILGD